MRACQRSRSTRHASRYASGTDAAPRRPHSSAPESIGGAVPNSRSGAASSMCVP
ncbi:hypothetical protein OV079_39305 [Nannocystis pusilla]|uniref:Uncharacterized protein n=1 Tax=Nannocystis pusilla TaxID=889268 RepID=A0A9X3EXS9_9BACT|nr:hypothetical protein [Nannocystis pusilla]MCY1011510.1 hypothetical protein [Nannocystis pusilla]